MKFIKLFKEQTAFDEAKSTLNRPNVSLIKTNRNVYSLTEEGGGNANGHSYVDLGLPSRLKWATMNVGATSETDYGDYFMWGSIEPNTPDECTWTNAPFNGGSSDYDETEFNSVKNTVYPNGILAKEYDAARVNMGGDWRMPTKAEIQELIDNTTKKWTQVNSVDGWKFTSKTDTSKYIFIPAAGYYADGTMVGAYICGVFWSPSLDPSEPSLAWNFNGDSVSADTVSDDRSHGLAVRGVL